MRNMRIATIVLGLLLAAGCQDNGVVVASEQTSTSPSATPVQSVSTTNASSPATTAAAKKSASPATAASEPVPQPFATQKPGTVALVGKVACQSGVPLHGLWLTHDGTTNPPAGHPRVERFPNDPSQAVYWEDFWPIGLSYQLNIMCGSRPDGNALSDFFTTPQSNTSIFVDCSQGLYKHDCKVKEYTP